MKILIPINECLLDMIEALNGGVRPNLEEAKDQFFVFNGKDEPTDIIDFDDAEKIAEWWHMFKICYLDI